MRTSSAAGLLVLTLAGCSKHAASPPGGPSAATQGRVLCAVDGAAAFGRDCTVERAASADGPTLIIRHPDGGFRKLVVATDGRGVMSADGAEPARVRVTGAREIEVAVGGDRYRLPATVKGRPLRP